MPLPLGHSGFSCYVYSVHCLLGLWKYYYINLLLVQNNIVAIAYVACAEGLVY